MEENKGFDLQKIKELLVLMETHNIAEIEVVKGDEKIRLKRENSQISIPKSITEQHPVKNNVSDENFEFINSTTPGTFYASVSQDSEPYVDVGSEVTPQTIVCIIEAMKVMNHVKSETTGTVVEVLVKSGQAVEYGTPLFKVKTKPL